MRELQLQLGALSGGLGRISVYFAEIKASVQGLKIMLIPQEEPLGAHLGTSPLASIAILHE